MLYKFDKLNAHKEGGIDMSIVLTRIDNRLLHGVVATQWAPSCGCSRLMVIDDEVANDPVKKETMKFGRPAGVNLSIIDEQTALTNFKNHKYEGQKVFIVTKNPETLWKVMQTGEDIKEINIGGTIQKEQGIVLSSRAFADADDVKAYEALHKHGVAMYVQYVPSDRKVSLDTLLTFK